MKTLRDILLHHHQAANARLDQVRQSALQTALSRAQTSPAARVAEASKSSYVHLLVTAWQKLIRPSRYIWSALAAVWLALFTINLELKGPHPKAGIATVGSGVAASQTFVEQRRVLAELLQSQNPAPADRPHSRPQPRSEGTPSWPHRIGRAPGARNVQAIA